MPTISYTYLDRCAGGGHFRVDVALDGGPSSRFVYTTYEIREPLGSLTLEQRALVALAIMKLHMAGKTRQEMMAEFNAGPVTRRSDGASQMLRCLLSPWAMPTGRAWHRWEH
jgi:hypothetical protein